MKKKNQLTFWNIYGIACIVVFVCLFGVVAFITFTNGPAVVLPDSIVTPSKAPRFALGAFNQKNTQPQIFSDSVKFGWNEASWGGSAVPTTELRSTGEKSLKVSVAEEWGGVIFEPKAAVASGSSVSFDVSSKAALESLYVEISSGTRNSYRAPLSWYKSAQNSGDWIHVVVPLSHASTTPHALKSISFISKTPTALYLDSIGLTNEVSAQSVVYVAPPDGSPIVITGKSVLPYSAQFNTLWTSAYGRFSPRGETALIGPKASEKGSQGSLAIFTDGGAWTDYRVTTHMKWGTTETYGLVARYTDDRNYVSCDFSDNYSMVSLFQVKNGFSTQLGDTPELPRKSFYERDIEHVNEIEVVGNRVSCYLDGDRVISMNVPGISATGTVAVASWTRYPDAFPHHILKFEVSQVK